MFFMYKILSNHFILDLFQETQSLEYDYINFKVRDKITYLSPNVNGCTVDVWEWISNFTQHLTWHAIYALIKVDPC